MALTRDAFVHLHVHSEYSLLDGACKIPQLIARAKDLGQTSIALTDHGVMYGIMPFYQAAQAAGIQPILGCEVYVAPRSRHDRDHTLDRKSYHLILLCETTEGYQNLVRLVSKASLEGFYHKPRVDWELLSQYHKGLICLSGCLAGEVPTKLLSGDYASAKQVALRYQTLFGKDNYYLEIQDHEIADERRVMQGCIRLSKETGIPLVATNDVHYILKDDAEMHHVLLCMQTGKTVDDPTGLSFETDQFYLKSTQEMTALFSTVPEAITNTRKIADRCHVEFETGKIYLPKFQMDGVENTHDFFVQLCHDGLRKRYGDHPSEEVIQRMDMEISVITQMGYVDYFLIVWDYVAYARKSGIPVGPGRGSGAGSICAYCLEITQIDPIRYHLLFERFLNPERVSMPDFDIDFCIEGRQQVKDYVVQRYGEDYVSEIITFDILKARSAIRDTGRAMGMPYELCDKLAKAIDPSANSIAEALQAKDNEELRNTYQTNSQAKKLLDMAMRLEGTPRHTSTHAAGLLISAVPIMDLVPLQKNDDAIVTQYPMQILEQMGFLKFDFLGLRNLTIMRDCIRSIHTYEPTFDLDQIPLDDPKVYEMLSQGDTTGVFQFESAGMRRLLMRLQPRCLEDLTAVLALYRPGPMSSIDTYIDNRRHPEHITYAHPSLKPILESTYGCILYQEQVMEICRVLAGYSYGRADLVRRAMAKKKKDLMEQERQVFLYGNDGSDGSSPCCGAVANGIPVDIASSIFDEISGFASYAFNKSHAVAYALLSYQTAYLKCHYYVDDMAALLTSVMGETNKLMQYLSACQNAGTQILPPHVNESMENFTRCDDKIRFGLLAIKNMGSHVAEGIIQTRNTDGPFTDVFQFTCRILPYGLNKQAFASLVSCGALDGLGWNRRQMLMYQDQILAEGRAQAHERVSGQMNLFSSTSTKVPTSNALSIPPMDEFATVDLLRLEHESIGFYLSGHPLDRVQWQQALLHAQTVSDLTEYADDNKVTLFVTVQQKKRLVTKKGDPMCFLTCEDKTGTVDCIVFPDLYLSVQALLQQDAVLCIQGKINRKEETVSVVCSSIQTPEQVQDTFTHSRLCIKLHASDTALFTQIMQVCQKYPGKTQVCYYILDQHMMITPRVRCAVDVNEHFYTALTAQCAPESVGILLPTS